jgi:hypothetical protein
MKNTVNEIVIKMLENLEKELYIWKRSRGTDKYYGSLTHESRYLKKIYILLSIMRFYVNVI